MMTTNSRPLAVETELADADREALNNACEAIAPVWPLDRWIAVNPWWGMRHLPMARVAGQLAQRGPIHILMPPQFYHDQWQAGRITEADLRQAGAERGLVCEPGDCLDQLEQARHHKTRPVPRLVRLAAVATRSGADLEQGVTNQVSQICARYLDRRQAAWRHDAGASGLYRFWREETLADAGLDARLGLPGLRSSLKDLPDQWPDVWALAVAKTGLSGEDLEAWGHGLLLAINGWASWCAGLSWRAGLEQRESDEIQQLLAVAMAWDLLCLAAGGTAIKAAWQRAWSNYRAHLPNSSGLPQGLQVWHRAYEIGFQRQLLKQLAAPSQPVTGSPARVQAVFCIDVRSEVLRRHLEHTSDQLQTLGFAGFFGLPIAHRALDDHAPMPRLPGLLAPGLALQDTTGNLASDNQRQRRAEQRHARSETLRRARTEGLSTFTLIEATGLAAGWKLLRDSLGIGHKPRSLAPHQRLHHLYDGDPLSDKEKVSMAEGLLRGMSLTRNFAPLVALVGHGAHTENNPNQAGLACGACGGQNGGINARAAASLLNDPAVRAGLKTRGIALPDFTWVLAAEHCTVTDRVKILDRDLVPESHQQHLAEFEQALEEAGRKSRRERATPLRLNGRSDEDLLKAMVERTRNWSEVRPEWGLANNAAILFAPRARTRGLDLGGRCFLHEYQPNDDNDGNILTALLSAPMVVANWINLQYFASVTAPQTYGAGNKLLHSVVGGNLGVLEGNDGDLRIGLPLQSVHDGERWRHEPVRLSVVIDAPRERIEAVLAAQPDVARLVENEWLFLCRWPDEDAPEWYRNGEWHPFEGPARNDDFPQRSPG